MVLAIVMDVYMRVRADAVAGDPVWVSAAGTCPLCRSAIQFDGTKVEPGAGKRTAWRLRIEAEHHEREIERLRRVEQERRIQEQMDDIFTVSGRPYHTLPLIDCAGARELFNHNRRELAAVVVSPVSSYM